MSRPENSPFLPYEARLMSMLSNGLEKLETKVDKNHQEVISEIKEGFDNVDEVECFVIKKKNFSSQKQYG